MAYTILKKEQLTEVVQSMTGEGKKVTLLSGDWNGPYAVAAIVIENARPSAEVHIKSADVWQVLSGNATFILGGNLVEGKEIRENELVADEIEGGEEVKVSAGDCIDIPPGTPHQIDAREGRVELLIMKVHKC